MTELRTPRLAIAGIAGDSGKTLLAVGLARALAGRGLKVQSFKKGPDYIDAAWLAAASGRPCRNLDTFLMPRPAIGSSVTSVAAAADLLLLEGNRGLYDGLDAAGAHSTAELAKLLGAPVVLVVNTTKVTRTVAAVVLGCRALDPEVTLAGVVLNRVGTARQEAVIREAVEAVGVPVLGALPRLAGADPLPDRHLGLVTPGEHPARDAALERAAAAVSDHVDVDALLALAGRAAPVDLECALEPPPPAPVSIGYLADPAFSFYYPENLERLVAAGARLVAVSPDRAVQLDGLDGLYVGGGFPEVHAARLADCAGFAAALRVRVAEGLPVWAECGGLMYLARELRLDGSTYPMAGVLDLVVEQRTRPQGHGYVEAVVDRANPFFAVGTALRGHEFHYSRIVSGADWGKTVLRLGRGEGCGGGRDGIVKGSVWASYLHLHAVGEPRWADGWLGLARRYGAARMSREVACVSGSG